MLNKLILSGRFTSAGLAALAIGLVQYPHSAGATHVSDISVSVASVDSVTRTVDIDITESTTGAGNPHSSAGIAWGDSVSNGLPWTVSTAGSPAHYKMLGVSHVYPDLVDRLVKVSSDPDIFTNTFQTFSTTVSTTTFGTFTNFHTNTLTSTTTSPGPTDTVPVQLGCSDTPMGACTAATDAQFQIKKDLDTSKDKLKFKWSGTSTFAAHDPTATTDYRLCVYTAGAIVMDTVIPPGMSWKATGSGFKYKDKSAAAFGFTGAKLKDGSIKIKGSGANLPAPTLPLTEPVLVQVQTSDGACFGVTLGAATKNTSAAYKAKGP